MTSTDRAADVSCRSFVPVSHHMFFLADGENRPHTIPDRTNGLADPNGAALVVRTGIHIGVVDVRAAAHQAPPPLDLAAWDEVVEVSLPAATGQLRLLALMDDIDPPPPALTGQPGNYRVRVHARGRDTDIDGGAFEPVEDYLIQVWPAPIETESQLKQTDQYGQQLRSAVDLPAAEPPPSSAPVTGDERERRRSGVDSLRHRRVTPES